MAAIKLPCEANGRCSESAATGAQPTPIRMLSASYGALHSSQKEKGVHNQGHCILKGWDLHESDVERVQASRDKSVVLENFLNDSLLD